MSSFFLFKSRNLLYATAATTTTLAVVQLTTPWFIRRSYSDCDVRLRYFWDHVETDMGGSFHYEDECDGEATHDSDCEALRTAGYSVGVFAILQLVAAAGIFLSAVAERWVLPAWYAIIAVALLTVIGLFIFLGQFPYRSGYCFYCLNSKGKINEEPCEYGTAYVLAWLQLVWLCIVIANPYFRALATSPTETTQALVMGGASSDKYTQFDDSGSVPSAPPMSTPTRQLVNRQQAPMPSSRCTRCLWHIGLAILMTILVLVVIIRYPASPSVDYCARDFNDETYCPAGNGYTGAVYEDAQTCEMLCGYSCCDDNGYSGLPTGYYLSLFVDIGSNCRDAVKHMGCASCHPYIKHYQTSSYAAADALTLVQAGNLPISVCDTWCDTLYHKCRHEILAANNESVKKTYSSARAFCEHVFAVDEVANFAFNKNCFSAASHISPSLAVLLLAVMAACLTWW